MTPAASPTTSPPHETLREEWIDAVDRLYRDAEAWAKKQEWATRRDPIAIEEPELGVYEIPRLLVHAPEGRLLLIPRARLIVGTLGAVELCVMPSYDSQIIARTEEGWFIYPENADGVRYPWREDTFVAAARELFKAA